MKTWIIAGAFVFMTSCAGNPISMTLPPSTVHQMDGIYSQWLERGFCVTPTGIENVLNGTPYSSPMPICNRQDIVFHSHPALGEPMANFADWYVWGKYRKLYGNELYGVMYGRGKYKIYKR